MASLMPHLGFQLGDALAAERRLAGEAGADRIASFSGRLGFLRLYAWFTPAANDGIAGHRPGADRPPCGCREKSRGGKRRRKTAPPRWIGWS